MGLREKLRENGSINNLALRLGIDLWGNEFLEGGRQELKDKDMPNLKLAQLFLNFNPNSGYFFAAKNPISKPYGTNGIANILVKNGYASNNEEGQTKANEIIKKGNIVFYWACKGAAAVNIIPYEKNRCNSKGCSVEENFSKEKKYRFELKFCDDGL